MKLMIRPMHMMGSSPRNLNHNIRADVAYLVGEISTLQDLSST